MADKEQPQVVLRITTDLWFTAEFLRELATAIEDESTDLTHFETSTGDAEIEWPEEALEDEEEN